MVEEKAQIVITDPKALENARADLQGLNGKLRFVEDPNEAANGCDAIAVVTEWVLYKDLDYKKIFKSMRKPAFIFDGRNLLDHQNLFNIGFNIYPTGKPKLTHFAKTH